MTYKINRNWNHLTTVSAIGIGIGIEGATIIPSMLMTAILDHDFMYMSAMFQ